MAERHKGRIRVGTELDPLTPVASIRMNMLLARAIGVDDLWLPDHVRHILPKSLWQLSPMSRVVPDLDAWLDPTTVIARYCRRRGPRMGSFVTDAVRRSPSDLARAWLSLQHVTGGNVVLAIGAGEAMNIDPVGLSGVAQVSSLEDTLIALRAAWAANGDYVTREGKFHKWDGAAFPPHYRGTVPPIWVAGQSPRTCGLAGRWGDGWMYQTMTFEHWQGAARNVAGAAVTAGKDPEQMEWSAGTVILPTSKPSVHRRLCSSPLIQAVALLMPGPLWVSVGAKHPFGDTFPGIHSYGGGRLEGDEFKEASKSVTPDLLAELLPSGPASKIADRLEPFISHGLSHVVLVNFAPSAGIGIALDSYREQRKLNTMLKRMSPGSRAWAYSDARVPTASTGAASADAVQGEVVAG